jgi:hypothetical protein
MPPCNTLHPPWPPWRNLGDSERHNEASPHQLSQVDAENSPQVLQQEAPPDGGYGWVCLGALFTINCFTWGVIAVSQFPCIFVILSYICGFISRKSYTGISGRTKMTRLLGIHTASLRASTKYLSPSTGPTTNNSAMQDRALGHIWEIEYVEMETRCQKKCDMC